MKLMYVTITLGETENGPFVYSRFDVDVELMKAYKGGDATYLAEESKANFDALLILLKERRENET